MKFGGFFEHITGKKPFPYQLRLGEEPWPTVIDVPTGLGKTASVIVAWLFKRLQLDAQTGLRLVYCLPMRVLVEQTFDDAGLWCERAGHYFTEAGLAKPTVHVLIGGDVDEAWEAEPEHPRILVGTQDMLLSRALNRGYGMSRYKWPVHFGLLNNDCLWLLDETQLVGVGVETSAQLQAFRRKIGTCGSTHTIWMSATVGEEQLETVDHPRPPEGWPTQQLAAEDSQNPIVKRRIYAKKSTAKVQGVRLGRKGFNGSYIQELAERVNAKHEDRGGLTLVVLNRVARAQALYASLLEFDGRTSGNTALVHSRFRRCDRSREELLLQQGTGHRIVVATQAVEAGVDVSARTMFSELAPWPALVQRFGRCNRYGDDDGAIFWMEIDTSEGNDDLVLPYDTDELLHARSLLEKLADLGGDAGPESLKAIAYRPPRMVRPVVRRRDVLDLFDTTPDLFGNDIDVSRYVRDGEDVDVQVFWRFFEDEPSPEFPRPLPDELCRVGVGAMRGFVSKLHKKRNKVSKNRTERAALTAWKWNPLDACWQEVSQIFAGQVVLLHPRAGGYDLHLGWTGEVAPTYPVPEFALRHGAARPAEQDALESDHGTVFPRGRWVPLTEHLAHVGDESATLAQQVGLANALLEAVRTAGIWHDVGKAHPAFQAKLLAPTEDRPDLKPSGEGPWAKSNHRLKASEERRHFRHELASALAWLQAGTPVDCRFRDLVAYLVAAHHGKVRMSIRSVPGEPEPEEPDRRFARGVWDGDVLLSFEMPGGMRLDSVALDLSVMQLGQGSWLERMLALRDADDLGPFRLALLETVVRIADWRASRKEQEGAYDDA